jgi:hypothetical protein
MSIHNSGCRAPPSARTRSSHPQTHQALVLLCEVLRRLESPFALVRFGRRAGQAVLKGFGDEFGAARGQFALDALTFTEGSYPVRSARPRRPHGLALPRFVAAGAPLKPLRS